MTTKRKPRGVSALVGRVVTLTKDSDAHHRHMKRLGTGDGRDPIGVKLIGVEGEVTSTWRDEGQWIQVLILSGEHKGELITMLADQVKVVRKAVDPEQRAELLDISALLLGTRHEQGIDHCIIVAQKLIDAVDAEFAPRRTTASADYHGHDPLKPQ